MNTTTLENKDFNFKISSFEIKEADAEKKWVRINGVALAPETSRNGISYTLSNIQENDGIKAKFFMTHNLEPDNIVGHVTFAKEGDKLVYDATVRNTAKYPDVTEMAKDKFFDVSIDGRYKKLKRISEENKTRYEIEGLEIRGLCAVGVGGMPSNSVDCVIAEEFKKIDIENELKTQKVILMEEEKTLLIAKENEMLKAKLLAIETERKTKTVEQIISLNKEFDKNKLMEKEITELEMILSYETKLSKVKEAEVPKIGAAQVTEQEVTKTEDVSGIVIESDMSMTMNKKMYDEFNSDIRKKFNR